MTDLNTIKTHAAYDGAIVFLLDMSVLLLDSDDVGIQPDHYVREKRSQILRCDRLAQWCWEIEQVLAVSEERGHCSKESIVPEVELRDRWQYAECHAWRCDGAGIGQDGDGSFALCVGRHARADSCDGVTLHFFVAALL